ncbi:hypothetical protein J2X46_002732 [Nocardioides sp. BE266]|uniref:recombinase RecT n=1 Tax=Nocardioides sp. BE266 TaxID=2817725 RepID=UPI00285712BF|nr:recombinase RecT [Nocardioides sp. BE266]MDR7253742.1 hypothetical protein [Nocardioides sp. BE266]
MTEIAVRQDTTPVVPMPGSTGANLIREAAAVMVDAHKLATAVASTQMIPKHFQNKPDELAAAMLYGASLNLDPMQSARQIYVVHGQAALYARAMDALVKGAGHNTWTVSTSDESVTVAGQRKGSAHIEESTWTFERAKKAGYTNNEKYRTDPQAMLYSKALSEVCRKIAPDVLNGVYAVEELQMEQPWDGTTAAPRPGLAAALAPAAPVAERPAYESPLLDTRGSLAKRMFATFRSAGLEEKEDRLAYASAVLGREIGSSAEMTDDDAHAVIKAMESIAADANQAGESL